MDRRTLLFAVATGLAAFAGAQGQPFDPAAIERAAGAKGTWIAAEEVFKVSLPRTDLSVVAEGVKLSPPMGLTSWAAFRKGIGHTIVMGDVVLTEDRVAPAMDAALASGLEVTALHNHFAGESQRVMFMHVAGTGDALRLADSVGKVFAASRGGTAGEELARGAIDPATSSLDREALDRAFGVKGDYSSGVYKVVVGRSARMHGATLGSAMGVNTWAALAGSMERAAVAGDVVMKESELQGVLKALRKAGIRVVAIHNHMTGEEPKLLFLHYWGVGPAESLAAGVRSALALTSTKS
ncbi:MAG TPA: DUF1259 domain-containing protein [Thermoanaerobaculia bacterium]|jgi:hypothetical protein